MSHMMAIDVLSATEVAAPRIIKRAPANTNPLEVSAAERKMLAGINLLFVGNADEVDRQIAKIEAQLVDAEDAKAKAEGYDKIKKLRKLRHVGLLNVPSASIIHQVRAAYSAFIGIEALMSHNMNAVAQAAIMGLKECDEVQGRADFIFNKCDGAHRNLASDERASLFELAMRLGKASRPSNEEDVTKALCFRALVCAAIAAEKGVMHLAKENYGAIIRALHREDCQLRSQINWTDELKNYARRHTNSSVKIP